MGAFFTPSEEPGVKRAKRSGVTLIPGSSDGTLCAAIAEQMSGVARSLRRKTLSLSPPCGWVHFKLPKWVKSKLALTYDSTWRRAPFQRVYRHFSDFLALEIEILADDRGAEKTIPHEVKLMLKTLVDFNRGAMFPAPKRETGE